MLQDYRYRPTNEIKIETKNKIVNKCSSLIKNIMDTKTLIFSYSKAERIGIKRAL